MSESQFADPSVSRAKFDREIAEFRSLFQEYRRRGWFLIRSEYPIASVVFVASHVKPSVVVLAVEFDYTNYDASPPSVRMVDPFSGEALKASQLPTPLNRALPSQEMALPGLPAGARMQIAAAQPYMQAHGPDEVPFLCLAGVREYHEHPAHSGDAWELHRASGAGRLVRLLEIIHKYGVAPITGFGVNLVPQINLNYGNPPE